eukprot:CAMPEP_0181234562 /NCGR_PEP_ID=MMETSP1096-20121128/37047_1 /TAXON_ID=156174 ORGANISM="Chrysochromulina ericina, Strain CCMP281" /NCGR_SAMPLE_ID=MMETSP1096 /ASSEMBLY_ACC=CAM_ASM_000453 /LENGTH=57 /DNA_ID=CAMNT_0023329361 /DNA_START=649 /DNA_END=819 /DNA_ORIENTATION=-
MSTKHSTSSSSGCHEESARRVLGAGRRPACTSISSISSALARFCAAGGDLACAPADV